MKIVYNIYVAVRKLWNAIFGKNGDGSQLVIPGRISGASGDVRVGSGLELGTGDVLNCTVPTPTTVVANPETTGTEADLTGLQVGDTKYKIESGVKLYQHNIIGIANFVIINSTSTAMSKNDVAKWLYDNGYRSMSKYYFATAPVEANNGNELWDNFAIYATNSTTLVCESKKNTFTINGSSVNITLTQTNINVSSITDNVIELK